MTDSVASTYTADEIQNYFATFKSEMEQLVNSIKMASSKPLYNNKDLIDILGVTSATLKKYRDEGMLGFSQIRDKYYYSQQDVKQFLQKTHYEPFYWA